MKICSWCKQSLPVTSYHRSRRSPDGLQYQCIECRKQYAAANPEKVRLASWRASRKTRVAVMAFLGNECVRCGFSDERALQIDHVHGGGRRERVEDKNAASNLYKRVYANPENYQVLCSNCNWIKRAERGEHVGAVR